MHAISLYNRMSNGFLHVFTKMSSKLPQLASWGDILTWLLKRDGKTGLNKGSILNSCYGSTVGHVHCQRSSWTQVLRLDSGFINPTGVISDENYLSKHDTCRLDLLSIYTRTVQPARCSMSGHLYSGPSYCPTNGALAYTLVIQYWCL